MAYNKFPFPLVELIQALLQQTSDTSKVKGQKCDDMADIPKTQWLLTAVVTFAERYLGKNLCALVIILLNYMYNN